MDRIFKEIFNYLQEKEMYYEGLLCTNARLNLASEQERSAEKCLNLVKDITEKIELNDVILASGDNTGVDETFDPTNGNIDGEIVIPL